MPPAGRRHSHPGDVESHRHPGVSQGLGFAGRRRYLYQPPALLQLDVNTVWQVGIVGTILVIVLLIDNLAFIRRTS
jgi:hypothetical protein